MQIWLLALVVCALFAVLGVWTVQRLYDTQGRCDVQSSTHVLQHATAPEIQPHGVRLWVDDGGKCIDGEVRHA